MLENRKRFHIEDGCDFVNKFMYYTKEEQRERNRESNRKYKHKFCAICSLDCKDYYKHIKIKRHLRNL